MSSTSGSDRLPILPAGAATTVEAPDGSMVHVLLATNRGSTARFELGPGRTSLAVRHRTVEEIWTVVAGGGDMWRRGPDGDERVDPLEPGTTLVIPVGTCFQFRSLGPGTLAILAVTMPPWPGPEEADLVEGCPGW